mmetsp:Transcript_1258/g.2708  ORF Transcript_1258/g.2708 Transcript_1258/m.2708 type:complete len:100 (-) Transcript_1258:279-578(-)
MYCARVRVEYRTAEQEAGLLCVQNVAWGHLTSQGDSKSVKHQKKHHCLMISQACKYMLGPPLIYVLHHRQSWASKSTQGAAAVQPGLGNAGNGSNTWRA